MTASSFGSLGWGPRPCGHLPQPEDGGCESDDGEEVSGCLFEAGRNAAKLLEFREAAFDEMALGVEMLVERIFDCARRIVGDDGERPFGGGGLAQVIGVIGGIGHEI